MFSNEFSYEPPNLLPQNRCFVRGFRQFHHMSQNTTPATEFAPCRHLTHPWQCDSQKTRNTTRLRLPRKMTMDTSKVLCQPRKLQRIFWKRRKRIAPALQNDFRILSTRYETRLNVTSECHEVARLPREATQHDVCNLQEWPFAELTIGNAIRGSCGPLRTVADGWATSSEHTLNPQTPEWNRNPCYAFGKNMRRGAGKKPLMRNRVQTQRKTKKAHYITYGQSEEEIGKGFFW